MKYSHNYVLSYPPLHDRTDYEGPINIGTCACLLHDAEDSRRLVSLVHEKSISRASSASMIFAVDSKKKYNFL